jgi:hypothetical protein
MTFTRASFTGEKQKDKTHKKPLFYLSSSYLIMIFRDPFISRSTASLREINCFSSFILIKVIIMLIKYVCFIYFLIQLVAFSSSLKYVVRNCEISLLSAISLINFHKFVICGNRHVINKIEIY